MKSDTSKQDFESIMQEGRARAESGKVEIHIEDVLAPVKPPPIDRMARFKRHPWVYIIPICVLGKARLACPAVSFHFFPISFRTFI